MTHLSVYIKMTHESYKMETLFSTEIIEFDK